MELVLVVCFVVGVSRVLVNSSGERRKEEVGVIVWVWLGL